MVSFKYQHRYADAQEALQALNPTILESKSPKKNSNSPKILLLTLVSAIALVNKLEVGDRKYPKMQSPTA